MEIQTGRQWGSFAGQLLLTTGLFVLLPLFLIHAHGAGFSIEEEMDGFFVDIGISEEDVLANEPVRFDFLLSDMEGLKVDFTDLWVRIYNEEGTFFAGNIHTPEFGPVGFTYVFPEAGKYMVSARYQEKGEEIVEYAAPIEVMKGNEEESLEFSIVLSIIITLIAFLCGVLLGRATTKRIAWNGTEKS